jgi:hypothetical protein
VDVFDNRKSASLNQLFHPAIRLSTSFTRVDALLWTFFGIFPGGALIRKIPRNFSKPTNYSYMTYVGGQDNQLRNLYFFLGALISCTVFAFHLAKATFYKPEK